MTCSEYRQGHPFPRTHEEAARAHEAQCAECRTFARSWDLLADYPGYPAIEPSAGFARGIRRKLAPAVLRFAAPLAAAAAALLLALLLTHPTTTKPSGPVVTDEERELVENLDLLQNYEVLRSLELLGDHGSPLTEEKK